MRFSRNIRTWSNAFQMRERRMRGECNRFLEQGRLEPPRTLKNNFDLVSAWVVNRNNRWSVKCLYCL